MPLKVADDPETDYRDLVRTAYNRCAVAYAGQRCRTAEPELKSITDRLAPGSEILDVGCGAGIPIAGHFAGTFNLTGIDISSSMIDLARHNVPTAKFITGDVMETEFPAGSFDAVVSFYTIFHIPRQEHMELFGRSARWLRPCGLLLVTLAGKDDGPGYTQDDFFGETMYWSNFGPATYKRFLTEAGFRIEREGILGSGYGSDDAPEEIHPFFFAVEEADRLRH